MGQAWNPTNLTPELCRAARGLLDWTQSDLAGHADVSRSTIRDFEGSRHELHRSTATQLCRAFEAHSVVFVTLDEIGRGVCLRQPGNDTGDRAG